MWLVEVVLSRKESGHKSFSAAIEQIKGFIRFAVLHLQLI